ncbi:MAG: 2-oxo acid dehydrogenase subunit E2 [Deltaproteobacteria bacterium]|nr:2-oxo acid dehydrogenase subunit E2 [Deltaproteobacteria bacterium]
MPKLSDTMEEGGIANWLKKEGEKINEGEPLVEIETDKATQEYESPEEGVVLKILVQPGKTVALRTPIAVVGDAGETYDLGALTGGAAKSATAAAAPLAAPQVSQKAPAKPATPTVQAQPVGGGRVKASPLARKVAAELGVDVSQIVGTGPAGRVVLRDIEQSAAGVATPVAALSKPSVPQPAAPVPAASTVGATVTPVSMMRKTIAKRLTAAKNEAPHFYLTVSANVAKLETWRQSLNDAAAKANAKGGSLAKVSVNDVVILAVARALRHHPQVNASWQGETIVHHGEAHIAVAVALPEGLVTPVIRRADVLGVREIAAAARDLATKAKDGLLSNDAFTGGTFTISNLGMFGVEEFTAIINPPQAAILAVGAATPTPWVDEQERLVVQQRMKMTLSCDHRVVDGATGAKFLQTLVSYLEDPMQMLV